VSLTLIMEHQSAVSIGSIFNPFNSETYDSMDIIRTLWHECAREWWENNVTIKDMADLWVHEAFATYAEVLAYDRWNSEVQKFSMPVKVTTAKNVYSFIYPTKDWKDVELKGMNAKDFKVATDKFYVGVVKEKQWGIGIHNFLFEIRKHNWLDCTNFPCQSGLILTP
jgi:hypothetical protein